MVPKGREKDPLHCAVKLPAKCRLCTPSSYATVHMNQLFVASYSGLYPLQVEGVSYQYTICFHPEFSEDSTDCFFICTQSRNGTKLPSPSQFSPLFCPQPGVFPTHVTDPICLQRDFCQAPAPALPDFLPWTPSVQHLQVHRCLGYMRNWEMRRRRRRREEFPLGFVNFSEREVWLGSQIKTHLSHKRRAESSGLQKKVDSSVSGCQLKYRRTKPTYSGAASHGLSDSGDKCNEMYQFFSVDQDLKQGCNSIHIFLRISSVDYNGT